MAIDTAAKRRAVSGILTGLLTVGVTPDATPDAAWRQDAGWGYRGIPVNPAPPVAVVYDDKIEFGTTFGAGTFGNTW